MKYSYWLIALFTIFILGLPFYKFSPDLINPDSYFYLSIANGYLYGESIKVRDAFTVGPVLPLFIAAAKYFLLLLFKPSAVFNVLFLKGLAIFIYTSICCIAFALYREAFRNDRYLLFLILLPFLSIYIGTDTISLNAELFSIPFFLTLIAVLNNYPSKKTSIFVGLLIAIFIFYIKLQSLLILILILSNVNKNGSGLPNLRLPLLFILIITLLEYFFYQFQIGYFWNSKDLISYVLNKQEFITDPVGNNIEYTPYLLRLGDLIFWIAKYSLGIMPFLILIPLGYILTARDKSNLKIQVYSEDLILILIVFLTIIIPNHKFSHYLRYFLLFYYLSLGSNIYKYFLNRYAIWTIFASSFLISMTSMHSINSIQKFNKNASQNIEIGSEFQEIVHYLNKVDRSEIFVHGYDYRIYAAFDSYDRGFELPYVIGGLISQQEYIDNLRKIKSKYIVDVVQYSGFFRNPKYTLENNPLWLSFVRENYSCVYNKSGLKLYKLRVRGT